MIEKGTIQHRDVTTGNTDGKFWKRVTLTINGKKFSSFNEQDARFNESDYVEIEYEQKGKYNNIKSIKMTEAQTGNTSVSDFGGKAIDRDIRMARMNALTNANNLIANIVQANPEFAKELLTKDQYLAVLMSTAAALTSFICEEEQN